MEAVPADVLDVSGPEGEFLSKRLEHYCAQEPYQWFNFYDYWAEGIEQDR